MTRAVVLSAVRTPVGRYGGGLAGVRPDDLAATVIAEAVSRAGVRPAEIEDVWLGCANQAGEDNRNVARFAALLAGLPDGRRRHRQPSLRVRARRRSSAACHAVDRRRRRSLRRRRRRVDDARAARDAEARRGVRARRPHAPRHDARLALRQPALRGDVLARGDGRDGENVAERWGVTPRGTGRVRPALAAALGGGQEAGRFADELVPVGDARAATSIRDPTRRSRSLRR